MYNVQLKPAQEEIKKCGEAFRALNPPGHWRLEKYDFVPSGDDTQEVLSYGAWMLDTRTSGYNVKRYRIVWHCSTERLSLVEWSIGRSGKRVAKCLHTNKTVEELNEALEEWK